MRAGRRQEHHPRRPDPLRDRHRRPEPAAGDQPCLRAPRQGPDRRRDELVRRRCRSTRARSASTRSSRPAASASRACRAWASSSSARPCSTAAPATRTCWRWTCTTSTSTWSGPASGASRRRPTWSRRSPRRSPVRRAGRPAGTRCRATPRTAKTLIDGMAALGFVPFLKPGIQAPIIVTFHAPADRRYDFKRFYEAVQAARLHPLSGQAHPGRDVSGRLHRRDRPDRDAASRRRGRRHDDGAGHRSGAPALVGVEPAA